MSVVNVKIDGEIAWITINNPPVNATSTAVRLELMEAVTSVQGTRLAVLQCTGKTFVAGGDMSEFDRPPDAPHLPDVVAAIEKSETPFLALDEDDPISLSYPWVTQAGGQYEMWYGSTVTWDAGNGEMVHEIKHATSNDGHTWQKQGNAIPYQINEAQAFSRPTVYESDGSRNMLFSYRSGDGSSYRIGESARQQDQTWGKPKQVEGLLSAGDDWDSTMVEYPFVWQHKDQTYMAYNGNEYGKSGFGLASLALR
jgi:hypothetical protein